MDNAGKVQDKVHAGQACANLDTSPSFDINFDGLKLPYDFASASSTTTRNNTSYFDTFDSEFLSELGEILLQVKLQLNFQTFSLSIFHSVGVLLTFTEQF